ncbi:MAG: oligosaccharide flippase family protein [Candidatus Omnitrophica bacterium]|nr:oligosaccharide flippase family protein [Candidatus Omnitrophota bacterium]MDD5552648.1 oligosaccharide flippase family protein [Candidatus Omnitrophota bacterium]
MLNRFKKIDPFGKNIILVFAGTTLGNVFNLLYQLLIAHRMSPQDFAGFNSLLSLFMLITAPLSTLHTGVCKYLADFNARGELVKVRALLSALLRKILPLAAVTCVIFYLSSFYIIAKLKIVSGWAGSILAASLAAAWISPVLWGALQGLELFRWFVLMSIICGITKLIFAFSFLNLGYNISGALSSFLLSLLAGIAISFFPLKRLISFKKAEGEINLMDFFLYLAPVAVSFFCFMALVNLDMVLVKYFFSREDAGFYSLAQMEGKIFLFLPLAISIVMFPKTAGLNAVKMKTGSILMKSLFYAFGLCAAANIFFNIFPSFILKALTGKAPLESIVLGRFFGVSMSFFALLLILMNYFLSIKDLRFMKYLIVSAALQPLAIVFFHKNLIQVQSIICLNSILLFLSLFSLFRKRQ